MAAYVIVDITVHDAATYERYRTLAEQSIAQYDGRYLVRGGAATQLEGERSPARMVVLDFPSAERAREWWSSEEERPQARVLAKHAVAHEDMRRELERIRNAPPSA